MSDGTLRQYANELMSEELSRLKLGYLVQVRGFASSNKLPALRKLT